MNWLSDKLSTIPTDKVLHVLVGYIVSDIVFTIYVVNIYYTILAALIVTSIVAGLKEVFDKTVKKYSVDVTDIIATLIGASFNVLINIIL
jgi:capsular polysaccharide biosynthesis protein